MFKKSPKRREVIMGIKKRLKILVYIKNVALLSYYSSSGRVKMLASSHKD